MVRISEEINEEVAIVDKKADIVSLAEEEEDDDEYETDDGAEETTTTSQKAIVPVLDDDEEDDDLEDESLLDRIKALGDIIPLETRAKVWESVESLLSWGYYTGRFVGSAAWILTTGAMILVLPAAIELDKEVATLAQENQARMQQMQAQQVNYAIERGESERHMQYFISNPSLSSHKLPWSSKCLLKYSTRISVPKPKDIMRHNYYCLEIDFLIPSNALLERLHT